jgi:hypothetical protein
MSNEIPIDRMLVSEYFIIPLGFGGWRSLEGVTRSKCYA